MTTLWACLDRSGCECNTVAKMGLTREDLRRVDECQSRVRVGTEIPMDDSFLDPADPYMVSY